MTTSSIIPGADTAIPGLKKSAAGVLFTDPDDRILLVEPTYKDHWDLPGGVVDQGETLLTAAIRELEEELDLSWPVGRLLVIDDLGTAVMAVFDGGVIAEPLSIRLQESELRSWAWCTPAQTAQRMTAAPILTRRVQAAQQAQRDGATYYLEHGHIRLTGAARRPSA
ncbi:NUDIX hydrolase [Catellatospora sp. NPDC049111]|uniref:NUDIX hydrolase n=1 Tax=Catellatospora sp. NPDC049111 TaxID=3155271 RepID=UPI0033F40997